MEALLLPNVTLARSVNYTALSPRKRGSFDRRIEKEKP